MMTRRRKLCIALALFLIVLFFVLPPVLGIGLRGTVEQELSKALGVPVKLGGLSVKVFFSPGVVLTSLEVGAPSPLSGNKPLATVKTAAVGVTWSTVFGGNPYVTDLRLSGAEVHVGCNETGQATLTELLAAMPQGDRAYPLPIDCFIIEDAMLHLHAPKAVLASQATREFDAVTLDLKRLCVKNLLLPAPEQPAPRTQWTSIQVGPLHVRSPAKGEAPVVSPETAGAPMDEGLTLESLYGELLFPTDLNKPLELRAVRIEGLKACNVMADANESETFERISAARATCLKTPSPVPGVKNIKLGNGSIFLHDLHMSSSALEFDGRAPAFWRMKDLTMEINRTAFGPGAEGLAQEAGRIKIAAPTVSDVGEGMVVIEWDDLKGPFPEWTFTNTKTEITNMPVVPYNARAARATRGAIQIDQGSISTCFAGPTNLGKLSWYGHVTFSKDFAVSPQTRTGKMVSAIKFFGVELAGRTQSAHVSGTLLAPRPDIEGLAKPAEEMITRVFFNHEGGVLGLVTDGLKSYRDAGYEKAKAAIGGLLDFVK